MIEFVNVSKVYNNGTEALHDINLKVPKGEFVFIVGSSGAGKSTFLKLITCEERPSAGQIIVDGQDISRLRKGKIPYVRRKMGMVFQDFRLIDHMTVYDNVAFAMRVVGASGKSIKKRVPYMLSLVGLQHKAKHYPTELSGGERQRVGLARALVNNPEMIIADEPTGNIDPAALSRYIAGRLWRTPTRCRTATPRRRSMPPARRPGCRRTPTMRSMITKRGALKIWSP